MITAGGSTSRRAACSTIAAGVTFLIVLSANRAAADASATADTASAAAIYEPVAANPASAEASSTAKSAPAASAAATADNSAPAAAAGPSPTVTTETVIVPASMPAPAYVNQRGTRPPSTTEIPSAGAPNPATAEQEPGTAQIDNNAANAASIDYQERQNAEAIDPQLRSLQDFMNEEGEISPLGVEVREDQRKLNSGEVANGLLIVSVRDGSPAAKGGLHPCRHVGRNIASGIAIAAALFFPPALVAVPLINQPGFAESYDMIIGVDGKRVVNFTDFEDSLRDLQPGETVYLSLVRNGDRIQLPVHVGSLSIAPF